MSILKRNVVTPPEEYLEGEKYSEVKHEYVNGHIYAMVGVSRAHNQITLNLAAALKTHLRGTPCRVFISDIKVRKDNIFYYPDVVVTCDETRRHEYYVEEPVLVVEVLSPSTEARDGLDKRLVYQSIPTLQEYVLLAQDKREAQLYRRAPEGWDLETYGPNEDVRLTAIDFTCPIETIYEAAWD
ncbi:MAG: Uma2 family endonuclease [Gammaproteobacteria bacterium]